VPDVSGNRTQTDERDGARSLSVGSERAPSRSFVTVAMNRVMGPGRAATRLAAGLELAYLEGRARRRFVEQTSVRFARGETAKAVRQERRRAVALHSFCRGNEVVTVRYLTTGHHFE